MTDTFSDIPIRSNSDDIDASWFNTIRTLLIQILGDAVGEAIQSIGNTDTDQDITELSLITDADYSKVDVDYMVRRTSTTADLFQSGRFSLHRKADGWTIHGHDQNIFGDDALITFSVYNTVVLTKNLVTVRYSTTDCGGASHVGELKVRAIKWAI